MATLADLLIEIGVDAKEVAKGASEVEGKLAKTWKGIGVGAGIAGAAIGAALMAGIDQVIETSKTTALLGAQLGGGQEFAAEMGKNAGEVYAKGVAESMDEAAGAIRDAWQNNLVDDDATDAAIQGVGNKLIALSKTTESSTKEVSAAVSQMLRNGLADSADEAFDIIQRGVEQGVNKSDDLLDTFNEYGTQFRKFGLSAEDALGLMSQGLRAGARDADTVADSIKEFTLRATDGTAKAAGGYKMLGLNADKYQKALSQGGPTAKKAFGEILTSINAIEDPQKRTAAQLAFFGTKAEDMGAAIDGLDLDKAAKGLGNVAGAADRAGKTLEESAGAKLESFKRKAQGALVEQLAKAVPYIEKAFGWFEQHKEVLTPIIIALGALAVALGIAAVAMWVMNSALLASPITWIIAAVLLLVGVIVYLATKTQFFQTIWGGVWGFMKAVGAWFAGPFAGFFVSMWNKIVASLTNAKNQFMSVIRFIVNLVKWWVGLHVAAVNAVISGLKKFVSFIVSVPGKVRHALSSMWDGMKSGFRSAINWVISKWNSLHFSIPSFSVLGKSFGGGTIGVPQIPQLANGALVRARAGGTLVNVGEGGQDEAVVPLNRMPDVAQTREDATTVVQIVPGGETEFRRWIKKSIRVKGPIDGLGGAA